MRYILDASVAVKWVLPEVDSGKSLVLRHEYITGVHQFLSPTTFAVEVAHALTRAERRRILAPGQANPRLQNVMTTAPSFRPFFAHAVDSH
jgi:predicted nucleic acid-binding protein